MAAELPPDLVAMMVRGVSVIVASRDAALRPEAATRAIVTQALSKP